MKNTIRFFVDVLIKQQKMNGVKSTIINSISTATSTTTRP